MKKILLLLILCTAAISSCKQQKASFDAPLASSADTEPKVFKKIPVADSGLQFENAISEDVSTMANLFNYDYFYNGAGVGVEDLNNDGLLDIFFCGNQVQNKLFFNQGKMVFNDVSVEANINTGKTWSNGITFVDINEDGWMDIYVSQGGPNPRLARKNLFFINKKDGTFEEQAESYGLADMGISTQSVFLDYDQDGDLDCLVMNENELYGVDPINLFKLSNKSEESRYYNSSHLYNNSNGKFTDVTKKSGLLQPIFGLGLSVSDFNNDGWLDFYIASDYYLPDALFINNQNGTFTDKVKEYTNQISYYGMGMDIADINNDNLQDIFVLDMAANDHVRSKTLMASMSTNRFDYLVNSANFQYQYMFNSLQLNTGQGKYSNIAQATHMANTDWSWSVLMADFDLDQDKDVYITNGYRKYALDNDVQRKVYEAKKKYNNKVPLEVKKSLYDAMPSEKLPNILFENKGDLKFENEANSWGLADFSFSNGTAIGDLDNDGDMDLVVNNIDENCFLYQNMTKEQSESNYLKVKANGKLSEAYPKISLFYQGKKQLVETRRVRGYRSSHENIAHFGLGKISVIDTVSVHWPSGASETKFSVNANTTLIFNEVEAQFQSKEDALVATAIFTEKSASQLGLEYIHKENYYDDFEKEILLPYKQSTLGPFISKGDFNGDQLEDVYLGGASGQSGSIYFQKQNGTFYKKTQDALETDRNYEDMEAAILDWDNDGDQDLFVVSGGNAFAEHSSFYADRLYLNDGNGIMVRLNTPVLEINPASGKSVVSLDYDKDGDQDLIVGNRIKPQNYPIPAASVIYENKEGLLVKATQNIAPELETFGIINRLIATDFDNDGWKDFIAVGEWTGIGIFKNHQGTFKKITLNDDVLPVKGWWFSINETDINADGLPDYLIGNVGSNIKFHPSKEKPLKVYANDFDENGSSDIVLSKNYNGQYVPVRGRECSSQQMPFIQEKFKTYNEFANANLADIYGEKLNSAYEAQATEFKSILLINKGNGNFKLGYLPVEAQFFPILQSVFTDVNNDGFEDAIVAGNIYNTEVETARLDAISGLVLLSDGDHGYKPMPWSSSGMLFDCNVKDLIILNTMGSKQIIGTQNNGPILIHQMN